MDIVTIDFETYYSREYSLSKMTTEAYVRDPRFEVIGVGVKFNNHPTDTYSGGNIGRFLKSLDYSDKAILCHNTAFDGLILTHHFGIQPKFWMDTLSMARPKHAQTIGVSLKALASHYKLGQKGTEVINALGKRRAGFTSDEISAYMDYCRNDVDLTYELFQCLRKGFPADEAKLIDLTIRMYTDPTLEIDRALLDTHLAQVIERKDKLLAKITASKADIMSNAKFALWLEALGVEAPMKTSPTTGKSTYAFSKTDADFLALQAHPDERVQALVAARLGVKSTLEETRTQALIGVAERGPLPIMLNYYGAHTGRFSGGDKMNLQNLPRGGTLRKALRAPKGKVLVACDSAQIEARVVAWVAGQHDLVQSFREKRDVYSEFATEVYGRKVDRKRREIGPDGKEFYPDVVEGFVGKTCVLGLGYGMGHDKFAKTLALGQGGIRVNIDAAEAKRIVYLYRNKNAMIPQLWNRCGSLLHSIVRGEKVVIVPHLPSMYTTEEGIRLPNGMMIRYPHLAAYGADGFAYVSDQRAFRAIAAARIMDGPPTGAIVPGLTRIYGGKVVENIVQALARIVVADQMRIIARRYQVVLQVHDEVVIVCDEKEAEEAKAFVISAMSTPPAWAPDLPIACEAHIGDSYGSCK